MRGQKGFTLVELIVVIAIIAILAAVAIPNFMGLQARARRGVDVANASAIASAMNIYNVTAASKLEPATGQERPALGEVQSKLTDAGLWPSIDGDADDIERAYRRISYENGIYIVNKDVNKDLDVDTAS